MNVVAGCVSVGVGLLLLVFAFVLLFKIDETPRGKTFNEASAALFVFGLICCGAGVALMVKFGRG